MSSPSPESSGSQSHPSSRLALVGPAALLAFAATVFGMVLAGGLDLTVPTLGASADDSPTSVEQLFDSGDAVAQHASATVASFADLAEAVLPAVVSVRSTVIESVDEGSAMRQLLPLFPNRRPGNGPRERRQDGGGSGFVISPDGWIVTNYHVVEDATRVTVVDLDGIEHEAEVKGQDPATDIALLKVDAENLPFLALGDSEALRVGDWVMAIGNPLQLASSVTVGVVSAKGRSGTGLVDRSFEDFIQTDAAINRGNSGGPLVDTSGRVIGIATAMNFGAENIGFAVPVRILRDVLPDLKQDGRVTRGYLGVNIRELTPGEERAFPGLDSTDGALVLQVVDGTPAEKAGLRAGDVIVRVDEVDVETTEDLISYVASKRPGVTVTLDLVRNGERQQRDVLLEERDAAGQVPVTEDEDEEPGLEWLGMEYQDLTDDIRQELRVPTSVNGVFVTETQPSSPLYDEGVRRGALIREVGGQAVDSVADFERELRTLTSGDYVRLFFVYFTPQGEVSNFAVVEVP